MTASPRVTSQTLPRTRQHWSRSTSSVDAGAPSSDSATSTRSHIREGSKPDRLPDRCVGLPDRFGVLPDKFGSPKLAKAGASLLVDDSTTAFLSPRSETAGYSEPDSPSISRIAAAELSTGCSSHEVEQFHLLTAAPAVSKLMARCLNVPSEAAAPQLSAKPSDMFFSEGSADSLDVFFQEAELLLSAPPSAPLHKIELLAEGEKIFDRFSWDRVLQEDGDGGKVVICKRKNGMCPPDQNAPNLVLKMRLKATLGLDVDRHRATQLALLNGPSHPGVVTYHEVMEDHKFLYMVMEYGSGGPLIQGLLGKYRDGVIPASALKDIMSEILMAIGHVHNEGFLHRDIKPDNLVMTGDDSGANQRIMLIDFDYAQPIFNMRGTSADRPFCGTPRFSAPECFLGFYSRASDLYSIGATLYLLMTGNMPYSDEVFDLAFSPRASDESKGTHMRRVHRQLRDSRVDWSSSAWQEQPDCLDFCQKLMHFDSISRPPSAEQALQHRWFTGVDDVGAMPGCGSRRAPPRGRRLSAPTCLGRQ